MMVTDCMLTTIDNPFNPFEQFTQWLLFDDEKGYNTCGKIARIAKLYDDMTQNEEEFEIEKAIDEIILHDPFNIYVKVTKENVNGVLNNIILNNSTFTSK